MSATVALEPSRKRSTGFTIDSIIGKQGDKCDRTSSVKSPERTSSLKPTDYSKDKYMHSSEEKRFPGYRNKHEGAFSPRQRLEEDVRLSGESDFSRDASVHSYHITDKHMHPSMDSLKHLHDVLAQTAGATGTYFHPRMCRHPLSALNLHSMYPTQTSPVHPLVFSPGSRDVRSLQPWVTDRYSGYFYPRYPGKYASFT